MHPVLAHQPYRSAVGRQRAFRTQRAVSEYDAGYRAFPAATSAVVGTPEWIGWADHRDDAEAFAAMDDCAAWAASHPAAIGLHP